MTLGFLFPALLYQTENWNQKSQVTGQGYIITYISTFCQKTKQNKNNTKTSYLDQ